MGKTARMAALDQSDLPALKALAEQLVNEARQARPVFRDLREFKASPEYRAHKVRLVRRGLLARSDLKVTRVTRRKPAPSGTRVSW